LYEALFAILALQGFHAAFAGIALPNPGSVALHEAVGFEGLGVYREVGWKHGRWRDVGWWRRAIGSGGAPTEPVPYPARLERCITAGIVES
jgi:phosphinothricin acetyltransferase